MDDLDDGDIDDIDDNEYDDDLGSDSEFKDKKWCNKFYLIISDKIK